MPIHFGTDGWRAVISDTFTFHNLRLVGQAIVDAVGSEHWLNGNSVVPNVDPHKMVVGYDTRFLSDRYAVDMARAGSQWLHGLPFAIRCSHPGDLIRCSPTRSHWRGDDYCFAQCTTL